MERHGRTSAVPMAPCTTRGCRNPQGFCPRPRCCSRDDAVSCEPAIASRNGCASSSPFGYRARVLKVTPQRNYNHRGSNRKSLGTDGRRSFRPRHLCDGISTHREGRAPRLVTACQKDLAGWDFHDRHDRRSNARSEMMSAPTGSRTRHRSTVDSASLPSL
jgi:hypothetical protein